jgi:hypothetical protein
MFAKIHGGQLSLPTGENQAAICGFSLNGRAVCQRWQHGIHLKRTLSEGAKTKPPQENWPMNYSWHDNRWIIGVDRSFQADFSFAESAH